MPLKRYRFVVRSKPEPRKFSPACGVPRLSGTQAAIPMMLPSWFVELKPNVLPKRMMYLLVVASKPAALSTVSWMVKPVPVYDWFTPKTWALPGPRVGAAPLVGYVDADTMRMNFCHCWIEVVVAKVMTLPVTLVTVPRM